MEQLNCVVIGAGVVGLAVARTLALQGREVVLVEAAPQIGTGISARNSEVIHAGLYYPTGSLKAQLCVRGKHLLYDYCAARHIPHQRCGKLVVATNPAQLPKLEALRTQAFANGVDDVEWLDKAAAQALEPELACVAALLSPSTGIVDTHALMLALLADAESAGAQLAVSSPVTGGRLDAQGIVLEIAGEPYRARQVINCAGLHAPFLVRSIRGFPTAQLPTAYFAKGNYFSLAGRAPFSHLIYPMPETAGLGVHLTLDLGGQARFGPDVEWLADTSPDTIDYRVAPHRAAPFYAAIRQYWPGLPENALQADYAGVRPKITAPQDHAADFCIQNAATHGVAGWVNLFGIESPGLTSCLALAEDVANLHLPR